MLVSETWLRESVNPAVDTAKLVERLTMAGLEVKAVGGAAASFDGVVIGEVRAAHAHPHAVALTVCSVWDGIAEQQVVCGAPNVRAGMRSAYARVGARLPDGKQIDRAQLRGVESFGMLCSAAELGIGDAADGIMDLGPEGRAGESLRAVLALDDRILDVDLTPNRGDCLSMRGIAREVGVLFDAPVTEPACPAMEHTIDDVVSVRLDDPAGCPRYLGRVIRGIDPSARTPLWMRERLRRGGLRSIDPVVDVTNYVMLELGQPMHAFDLAVLQQPIVVRNARDGETLVLLDGQEVTLDSNTLLITDAGGPIAMAGVMGGVRNRAPAMCSSSARSSRRWQSPGQRVAMACKPMHPNGSNEGSTTSCNTLRCSGPPRC
jgi:phenylalanyl-tRNA synthetase beta chain